MELVTIDTARVHCKADGDDDALLTVYFDAAEAACAQHVNRNLYPDDDALQAAIAEIPAAMATAFTTYDTAMLAAAALTDNNQRLVAEAIAKRALQKAQIMQHNTLHGIVATPNIIAAVLLTGAHFYANREDGASIPGAATNILDRAFKDTPEVATIAQRHWGDC